MRRALAILAVPLIVVLLTWLSLRAADDDAELFDQALGDLEQFAVSDAALHRDVLAARAGLLRNYDPLVREVNALYGSVARLRHVGATDAETRLAIRRLSAAVGALERQVEQFKSDNALLQNALGHFSADSSGAGLPGAAPPPARETGELAAAVLHLTLDTSPAVVHAVQERLDALRAQLGEAHPDPHGAGPLVANGELLLCLLPRIDAVLKTLSAAPEERDRDAVRLIILDRQAASRTRARDYRLLLYIASLGLVALLIHLGLELGARARAIRRRAAFEHVIADVSMRLIDAKADEVDLHIERALAAMAECVGADRAYVLLGHGERNYAWYRQGADFPRGWPQLAPTLAAQIAPALDGIVHVPRVGRLPDEQQRRAYAAFGLQGWACASGVSGQGMAALLGFDAVARPSRITEPGELGLLRVALDIIVNAVGRQAMEVEKARLQAHLAETRRMEAAGAMASGIAHNFNNIVAAILGYVEMAHGQLAAASRPARYLEEIRCAAERARDLVDQILAFGRRREAKRRPVRVDMLIAESVSMLGVSLPPEIELDVSDKAGAIQVFGDPAQLQQVIMNLVSNAAQAMDGVGRVAVETAVHEVTETRQLTQGEITAGRRYVSIAVSDNGRGMDSTVMARIFDPFFTTRDIGNGLGLATVREILRDHGGAIDVSSLPGVGSRFESWLPCLTQSEPEISAAERELTLGGGESVLLINASVERRLQAEELVAALGYEPTGFASVDDALAACSADPDRFDVLIVADPAAGDGVLALASRLHAVTPDIPVLLVTDFPLDVSIDQLMAAGVREVMTRPVVATDLAAALRRCLGGGALVTPPVIAEPRAR